MSHQDMFNEQLEIAVPLSELWAEATPYSPLSPRKDMRRDYRHDLLIKELLLGDYAVVENDTEKAFEITTRHLERLQDFGMKVVSYTFELEVQPTDDEVIGYRATRYVKSSRPFVWPSSQRQLSPKQTKNSIIRPLQKYFRWCNDQKEPYFLSDIDLPDQYSWHVPSNNLFLHDVDPYVSSRDSQIVKDKVREIPDSFNKI